MSRGVVVRAYDEAGPPGETPAAAARRVAAGTLRRTPRPRPRHHRRAARALRRLRSGGAARALLWYRDRCDRPADTEEVHVR